jgi:hypothetical protein
MLPLREAQSVADLADLLYEDFVRRVSFAAPVKTIGFREASTATWTLR